PRDAKLIQSAEADLPPGRATVWTSPRRPGQIIMEDRIVLPLGPRWICVEPQQEGRPPFAAVTPHGTVRSQEGCFFVASRPEGVVVTVLRGEAVLETEGGSVAGGAGDVLVRAGGEPPGRLSRPQP